jgi:hypothetical protein
MPYHVEKKGEGFKVTSPNHPGGFSKKPQTKAQAEAQKRAIYANTKEEKPHEAWAKKVKG